MTSPWVRIYLTDREAEAMLRQARPFGWLLGVLRTRADRVALDRARHKTKMAIEQHRIDQLKEIQKLKELPWWLTQ